MATAACQICCKKFETLKLYNQHLIKAECPQGATKTRTISPAIFQKDGQRLRSVKSSGFKRIITETIQPQQRGGSFPPPTVMKNGKARCELCMKMIKTRGMTQHLNIVHKCGYCGELKEDREDHITRAHLTHPCQHCTEKFAESAKLEDHVQTVHIRSCQECDDKFLSQSSLENHIEEVHACEYCDICDEKLRKADNLMAEHQDKVHGIKQKVIKEFGGGMMFMMVSE